MDPHATLRRRVASLARLLADVQLGGEAPALRRYVRIVDAALRDHEVLSDDAIEAVTHAYWLLDLGGEREGTVTRAIEAWERHRRGAVVEAVRALAVWLPALRTALRTATPESIVATSTDALLVLARVDAALRWTGEHVTRREGGRALVAAIKRSRASILSSRGTSESAAAELLRAAFPALVPSERERKRWKADAAPVNEAEARAREDRIAELLDLGDVCEGCGFAGGAHDVACEVVPK